MLRLALTKGRLEKKMLEILSDIGLDVSELYTGSRKLIYTIPGESLELMLAKAADVVTYVELGACDMGVVGKDTIMEHGSSFYEMTDLGFGKCRFALAVKQGEDFYGTYKTRRIATKYPNVAKKYFAKKGIDVDIIKIEGSVELAPIIGIADGIVDIVETGNTLRENGLTPIESICDISARLIVNIAAMKLKKKEISDFLARVEAATAGDKKC
jgi:ATP phosphoribosyltransferase